MSGKSRYDRFIPLFGDAKDKRVRLFIHDLEEQADKARKGAVGYNARMGRFFNVSEHMKNKYFANKDQTLGADVVHPEWRIFLAQLAVRIHNDSYDKPAVLKLVKSLSSARSGSIEELVWLILVKCYDFAILQGGAEAALPNPERAVHNANLIVDIRGKDKNVIVRNLDPLQLIIHTGRGDNVDVLAAQPQAVEFSYNIDKFFVSLMMEDALEAPLEEEASSAFFDDIPGDNNLYYRKADGLLYENDGSPSGKPVHMGSEAFQNMRVDEKCLTTGLPDDAKDENGNVVTCADYLRDCLAGKSEGVDKCKKYMTHHQFWSNAQNEANTILPAMIVKTLTSFGFDYKQYKHDVTGQQLWRFQSVAEWIATLNKLAEDPAKNSLTPDEVKNIAKNEKLLGYLGMLLTRVNENPVLLNEGYNGPTNERVRHETAQFGLLPKFGLKLHMPTNNVMSVIERTNMTLTNHINNQLRAVALIPVLRGGANTYVDPIERASNLLKYQDRQSWVILQDQYEGLKARLNMFNKSISANDDKTIRGLIVKLRDAELKLTKTVLYGEKYAKLLEVFGVDDGRSVLSFNHLAKFVDAKDGYLNKVRDRQNSLTSIIRTVAEAVAKESANKPAQESWDNNNSNHGKARPAPFHL